MNNINKILQEYKEILFISMDNKYNESIYYEKYPNNVYKLNSVLHFYNQKISYNRIFEGSEYIDFVRDSNSKFNYKHFSYLYDPDRDSFITFKDPNIRFKPMWEDKVYFTELYLDCINSSIINIYLDKNIKIGKYYIDYTNRNITMFDYIENKVYRYTKNASFESNIIKISDPCLHNNIIDYEYETNNFDIIKGNIYYNYKSNIIESIYDYNIPASIYENMYENMVAKVNVSLNYKTNKIEYISRTIYTKKE